MHATHRLQPVKAAALVAAVMLLSVALAAAAGSASGACHHATCAALQMAPASSGAVCAHAASQPARCTPCGRLTAQAQDVAPCAAAPAGWRHLDLPPPAR